MYATVATAVFPSLSDDVAVFPRLGHAVAGFAPAEDFEAAEAVPEPSDVEVDPALEDAEDRAEPETVADDRFAARDALEKLYREHGRRIYALAWRSVHDRDEALDIVQEAFVKAHQTLHRFGDRKPHYAWLHRVVVNICIDRRRRRQRWTNVEPSVADVFWPAGSGGEDPERIAGRQELQEAILQALQELSPSHRMVITLREFGGISYTEIADVMACRRGTVMSRLFHARRKLRAILEDKLEQSQLEPAGS